MFDDGMIVIFGSGFCILKALLKLEEYLVCDNEIIKKRTYWSCQDDVDTLGFHFFSALLHGHMTQRWNDVME